MACCKRVAVACLWRKLKGLAVNLIHQLELILSHCKDSQIKYNLEVLSDDLVSFARSLVVKYVFRVFTSCMLLAVVR